MAKTKAKRLLSLLLSLAMVFSLTVAPVYATDDGDSGGTTAATTGEGVTYPEPEAVEAEAVEVEAEDELEAEVDADAQAGNANDGISLASEDGDESGDGDDSSETTTNVATVDGTGYASLSEAFAAASTSNGTVKLAESVALDSAITVSGTVTLDLNGCSITRDSSNTTAYLIKVESGASLTVKDDTGNGYIDGDTYTTSAGTYVGYAILTNGTVTLESGTLKGYRGVQVSGDNAVLNVKGGTVSGTYTATNSYGIYQTGGTVNITSGTVSGYRAIYGTSGTVNVSGGTVSGTQIGIMANGKLTVNVSDSAVVTGTHGIYGYQDSYTGTVTVSGGTVGGSSTSYGVNMQGGTATITSGTVTASSAAVIACGGANVTIGTKGSESGPTITGTSEVVEIQTSSSATASSEVTVYSGTLTGGTWGICVFGDNENYDSKLNVYGGTITAETFAISGNGTTGRGHDEIYIYGGTITSEKAQAIYHPQQEGTMYVYGGTITGDTGIEVRGGTVVIDDDADKTESLTIKATGDPTSSEADYSGSTTTGAAVAVATYNLSNITVTINSGTLIGASALYESNPNSTDLTKTVTITMTGGTYKGDVTVKDAEEENVTVSVTGGTYSTDVYDYCTSVYTTEYDEDTGTYSIVKADAVASITSSDGTTTQYSTLARAFDAAQSGDTITLLADVTLNESLVYDNSATVTLDLNGKTITFAYDEDGQFNDDTLSDGAWGLKVASGSMTIVDGSEDGAGTIKTADENTYVDVVGASGEATLTIKSGTFTTNSTYEAVVFATGEAKVYIEGGTFTNSATEYKYNSNFKGIVLNVGNSSSATISVTGGTFYGESPASGDDSSSTSSTQTSFVATEYAAYTISENGFVVAAAVAVAAITTSEGTTSYTSLSDAFSAVKDGQTIDLLQNVTDSSANAADNGVWQVDGKSVTLNLNNFTVTSNSRRIFGVLNGGSLTVQNGSVKSTYASSDVTVVITRAASTFKAEGVTFDASSTNDYLVYAAAGGTVSLTSCKIENVKNAVVKDNGNSASITLKGCTYTKTPIVGTNVDGYTIIINGDGGSITSTSGAPEIDSNGIVRLDFNYVVEDGGSIETTTNNIYLRKDSGASSLTVNGGTVNAKGIEIRDTTSMVVNGGTITLTDTINVMSGGTLAINDEEEDEIETKVSAASINVNSDSSMTVTGGTVAVSGTITVKPASSDEGSKAGVLTISGGETSVGQIYSDGSIVMEGGTVTSTSSYENGAIYAKSGSISITDGTVTVEGTRGVVIDDGVTGTITGGSFTANNIGLLTRGIGMTISGGSYTATTGLYTKDTSVLATGYGAFNTAYTALTATSSGEYKSTLDDKTVLVAVTGAVAKIDSTYYSTVQSAIDAAQAGDTVTLIASTNEDVTVAAGQDITLDLAGCTLTNVSGDTITVELGATLTITDSSATEDTAGTGTVDNITHAKAAIFNNGTVVLNGGSYTRSAETGTSATSSGTNTYYNIVNHGDMTINSGVTVSQNGGFSSLIENGYYSYTSTNSRSGYVEGTNQATPTLTINGGTFNGGLNTVKNDDGAVLTINGGTFTNTTQAAVLNWNVATINNGTFTSTGAVVVNGYGNATVDKGELTITGGSFTAGDGYEVLDITDYATSAGTITITGGSYSDDSADTYLTGTEYQLAKKGSDVVDEDAPEYYVTSVITGKNIDIGDGIVTLNVNVRTSGITGYSTGTVSVTEVTGNLYEDEIAATVSETMDTVSMDIPGKMMANTLTVTVTLSDSYVVTYQTSVKKVANEYLSDEAYSSYYDVLKAMLNFGAALQKYSNYNVEDLANEGYEATGLTDAQTMYDSGAKLTTKTTSGYDGTKLSSMNIVFDHDFTVKLSFNATLSSDNLESVSLNGTELVEGTNYTVSGKVIIITGLGAADLKQKISVVTKDTSERTKTTNLPGLYYAYLLTKTEKETSKFLGQTLYAYSNAVAGLQTTSN